jgi:drug/metabolite transporter superfamily protein YnfA
MKIGIYILAVVLLLLGAASIMAGFGIINIISSAHHLRYELGGALIDIVGIALIVYAARRK